MKGGINLYIELQKHINGCKKNIRNSIDKRIPFSKQSYGVSEENRTKANMIPVTRIYLLYVQTVLIIAGPGAASQFRMQVSNSFSVNVIFCHSKIYLET